MRATLKAAMCCLAILSLAAVYTGAQAAWEDDPWAEAAPTSWWSQWSTLFSFGLGGRLHNNPVMGTDATLLEARIHLEREDQFKQVSTRWQFDTLLDKVDDSVTIRMRELSASLPLRSSIQVRAGRQILTWGTGDLLFINDLFPKDWQSFFAGRQLNYLKAPSDAVKFSYFSQWLNVDLVWSPEFDSDNYLTGERFSFFSPASNTLYAAPPRLHAEQPDASEWALRLSQNAANTEWALYHYQGHYKQPLGAQLQTIHSSTLLVPYFPELRVFGLSARRTIVQGIGWIEMGRYQSLEDRSGSHPLIPNSQDRFLIGYEQELVSQLTLGMQLYWEHLRHYSNLLDHSPQPKLEAPEWREWVTMRLSYRLWQQKLRLTWFSFYSPRESEYFILPSAQYRFSDQLQLEAGLNLFAGAKSHTFFSQLEENSNFYSRVSWYF